MVIIQDTEVANPGWCPANKRLRRQDFIFGGFATSAWEPCARLSGSDVLGPDFSAMEVLWFGRGVAGPA